MNDSEDVPKKTSRRRFTKTAASALVAMPVIASLSSCKEKSVPPPPPPPGTPTPTPTGTPSMESSNPPIIIDGGSLSISLDTKLKRMKDRQSPPWKHNQEEKVYGAITYVRLMNEYGYPLRPNQLDFPVGSSDLELKIWLQTADDDPAHPGEVNYSPQPIPPGTAAQFLLTNKGEGRTFEIRYVDEIKSSDRHYGRKRPRRKYREDKLKPGSGTLFGKSFRIGKVGIKVSTVEFETSEDAAQDGFRIVVFMNDPS